MIVKKLSNSIFLTLLVVLISGCAVLENLLPTSAYTPASVSDTTYRVDESADFVGGCLVDAKLSDTGQAYAIEVFQSPFCSEIIYVHYGFDSNEEELLLNSAVLFEFDSASFVLYSDFDRYEVRALHEDQEASVISVSRR